jgi:hypothetical protein
MKDAHILILEIKDSRPTLHSLMNKEKKILFAGYVLNPLVKGVD